MKNIILPSVLCTVAAYAADEQKYTYVYVGKQINSGDFEPQFYVEIPYYTPRYATENEPIDHWDLQRLTHMVALAIAKEQKKDQYPKGQMVTQHGHLQPVLKDDKIEKNIYLFEIKYDSADHTF
jgi:hypothetical protein